MVNVEMIDCGECEMIDPGELEMIDRGECRDDCGEYGDDFGEC